MAMVTVSVAVAATAAVAVAVGGVVAAVVVSVAFEGFAGSDALLPPSFSHPWPCRRDNSRSF